LLSRDEKKNKSSAALALLELSSFTENLVPGVGTQAVPEMSDSSTQTDISGFYIEQMDVLNEQQNDLISKQINITNELLRCNANLQTQVNLLCEKLEEMKTNVVKLESDFLVNSSGKIHFFLK
jgi:hypothetical protein